MQTHFAKMWLQIVAERKLDRIQQE